MHPIMDIWTHIARLNVFFTHRWGALAALSGTKTPQKNSFDKQVKIKEEFSRFDFGDF